MTENYAGDETGDALPRSRRVHLRPRRDDDLPEHLILGSDAITRIEEGEAAGAAV